MTEYFALLDNNYDEGAVSYLFTDPVEWITCHDLKDVDEALARIEACGAYAVGYFTYEFAQHFGYFTKEHPGDGLPFLEFGVFKSRQALTNDEVDAFLSTQFGDGLPFFSNIAPQTTPDQYQNAISEIKSELEAGNTYQVNYTFETQLNQGGCVFRTYDKLRRAQPVPYGAFLNFPSQTTLSRSPELFFAKQGNKITCKPMKGTEPRSSDLTQDQILRSHLVASPKQRAENLMIVDLLRNDLSRIAEFGTVAVDRLFEVESYATVHQMTSTITAQIHDNSFSQILEALFPCGSITGAPKLISTKIINRLETNSRGIYCGAIGAIEPTGDMIFNVPIRTLQLEQNLGRFHIGGGVVYDSVGNKEYDEALLKGKFLFDLETDFNLLDSHHFSPEAKARHLPKHLARLGQSAAALGFPYDETKLMAELDALYTKTDYEAKIRIELAQNGEIMVEAQPLDHFGGEKRIILSSERVHSTDQIYAHKTTNRALYNREFTKAREMGAYDVIFANEKGELTEGAIHNLALRMGDEWLTPPLSAGVLPGIGREIALENGEMREAILPISALQAADEICLISSVRGFVPVSLFEARAEVPSPEIQG